ncbi:PIN domain-containing protein [Trinickia sp. LjRoot230]|uniref:type II toxin-antitoxin system VapC family toxin n=1 Tax=Trinickia sp. LjRoot230 TaxID=3342288 RepID=UPI003ECD3DEF
MILVDTSVWIDHLRSGDAILAELLVTNRVLAHPFVTGEIALGSLKQRKIVLNALQDLPQASVATDAEVFEFINRHRFYGLGIGYVDAHLLAAARLTSDAKLWTRDRRLAALAKRLNVNADLIH